MAVDGPPRVGALFGCVPSTSRLLFGLILFWIEGPRVVNFFFLAHCSRAFRVLLKSAVSLKVSKFISGVCFDIIYVSYGKICVL